MKQVIKDLENEKSELSGRIERVKKFYYRVEKEYRTVGKLTSISEEQCTFIGMQLNAMDDYKYYLSERIKDLKTNFSE